MGAAVAAGGVTGAGPEFVPGLDGVSGTKGTVGLGATSDAATGSGLTIDGTAFAVGDSAPGLPFASDFSGPNLASAGGIIAGGACAAATVGADSRATI